MHKPRFGNRILDLLPASESAVVLRSMRPKAFVDAGFFVYRPGQRLKSVYFPTSCVLSAVTIMQDGTSVEVGTVGREGIGGTQAALNVARIPSEMVCQVGGEAYSMSVDAFERAMTELPGLRSLVNYYLQCLMNLMSQSIACNRLHSLTERCAHWLLLTRDRVGANEFHLTHEYLAYMLGVRRSGVTIAAGALRDAGAISYHRGDMTILNAKRLEKASCECYRVVADEFDRLLPTRSL